MNRGLGRSWRPPDPPRSIPRPPVTPRGHREAWHSIRWPGLAPWPSSGGRRGLVSSRGGSTWTEPIRVLGGGADSEFRRTDFKRPFLRDPCTVYNVKFLADSGKMILRLAAGLLRLLQDSERAKNHESSFKIIKNELPPTAGGRFYDSFFCYE